MERFGTSPVRNTYWEFVDEDKAVRDLMYSTACKVEVDDDIEEFEGIAFELTDDGIKTSKGWKDFFSWEM
jgi:hypothetical protein